MLPGNFGRGEEAVAPEHEGKGWLAMKERKQACKEERMNIRNILRYKAGRE